MSLSVGQGCEVLPSLLLDYKLILIREEKYSSNAKKRQELQYIGFGSMILQQNDQEFIISSVTPTIRLFTQTHK